MWVLERNTSCACRGMRLSPQRWDINEQTVHGVFSFVVMGRLSLIVRQPRSTRAPLCRRMGYFHIEGRFNNSAKISTPCTVYQYMAYTTGRVTLGLCCSIGRQRMRAWCFQYSMTETCTSKEAKLWIVANCYPHLDTEGAERAKHHIIVVLRSRSCTLCRARPMQTAQSSVVWRQVPYANRDAIGKQCSWMW